MYFDIGRNYLESKHGAEAAKWLERAAVVFEENDLSGLNTSNLQLNVLHTYARASLQAEDANTGLLRARAILEILQQRYEDNIAVSLLQLEIASRGDLSAYFAGIDALSQSQVTDSHYRIVMYHIHHLWTLDPAEARRSLKRYLVERLAVHGNKKFVESALISLVWMSTSPECTNETASLDAAFTELRLIWTESLRAEATNGILLLLWRRIEKAFEQEEYGVAASWCKLVIHQLSSESMDDLNAGKIQRLVNRYT